MKPKLKRVIYVKQNQDIYKGIVYMKGENSFLFTRYTNGFNFIGDLCELSYNNYNINWFTSLRKAKDAVIEEYTNDKVDHIEFEKHKNYWCGYVYDKY